MSEKKYVIDNKKLMSEWDWQMNNELGFNPKKLSCVSHEKVFWVCKKHNKQYSQVIRDKIRGQLSCKQCFNEREFEPRRKRYLGNKKVLAETHPIWLKNGFLVKTLKLPLTIVFLERIKK